MKMWHPQAHSSESTNSARTCEQLPPEEASAYEAVAIEYYEPHLHPTCAAFGKLSECLIRNQVASMDLRGKAICDVGAGRSVVATVLGEKTSELDSLWIVDASEKMLRWSDCFQYSNIERRIANAESVDLFGAKFDVIVAGLGDPFNTASFWCAVSRSLKDDGICIFTTPSYEWAASFRSSTVDEQNEKALFLLSDGSKLYFPSFVYSADAQSRLLLSHDLELRSKSAATAECLNKIPPKLAALSHAEPVISLYEIVHRRLSVSA